MSGSDTKKKPNWLRRIGLGIFLILIFCIATFIGLRWWVTTDSGLGFIERQIEARQIGPIERVEIDDLTGDPLSAFSIRNLRLYDEDGLWLTASDLNLSWSPWPLRKRHLVVRDLDVSKVEVLRRPLLKKTESGEPFTARLDDADIAALNLGPAVLGQAATLQVDAQGRVLNDQTVSAILNIVRTDIPGDALTLDFSREANGNMSGTFEIEGQPQGPIAQLFRAPAGKNISGSGNILGTLETGSGTIRIDFGDLQAIKSTLAWSIEQANFQADIRTTDWGLFDQSRTALGDRITLSATLDRSVLPQKFAANASAPDLDAKLSGEWPETGGLPSTLDFDLQSKSLSAILPLPDGYQVGSGSLQGQLIRSEILSGQANINIESVVTPYGRAAGLSGPLALKPQGSDYVFDAALKAVSPVTTAELPFTLGQAADLKATGRFNPETLRVSGLNAILSSAGNQSTAKGNLNIDGSEFNLAGQAKLNLKPIGNVPPGALDADYDLAKSTGTEIAVTARGTFRPEGALPPPLGAVTDDIVSFDIDMTPIPGGIELQEALLGAGGVRVAALGRVTDRLDLSAEINLSRPVSLASLDLSAPSQFSAKLSGARENPNLRLDGTLDGAKLAGQSFEAVRLRTEISDILSAPKGPFRLNAETAYGPLDLEARLASTAAGYAVQDLELTVAELRAAGDLALDADQIATGQIFLVLPEAGDRYARAKLDLRNVSGEQGLTVTADAENVAYGRYAFETFSLDMAGTLAGLTGDLALEGRDMQDLVTREFALDSPLRLSRSSENLYRLEMEPTAEYGRYQIGSRGPVTLEYATGRLNVDAPLTLSGQALNLEYKRLTGSETLSLTGQDLPVGLLPLPGTLAESKGRISIDLNLRQNEADSVSGKGEIQIADWRGFDFKKGEGFTTNLVLDFQSRSINWQLGSEASENFRMQGQGRLPINSSRGLASIRPDLVSSLDGQLNFGGSAKPLLSLTTPEEAEPDGSLDARLDIGGTLGNPQIEGQASGQALRLELPQLGTRLRDGRFTATFTNDTIDVRDVYVRDTKNGTLEGGGQFKLGEYARPIGRLEVRAKAFRVIDRKDYEGQVSGTLFFESDQETATLGGNVKVDRAEVKQFVQGRAAVVEIEVEEINGQMDAITVKDRPASVPVKMDLRVRAPRSIFVRTNGLDVELDMDVTIKGTVSEPLLFGEANVRRGGYRIAGKELQFSEGGIEFDGSLNDAEVNLIAETQTQNINATVNITGTVEDPEIELSSTPERPQDEILSALLFGRSVTELSTIEAAQLAGALAQFSGAGGGFDLMGGLRDALGVGQLSIGVGEDGQALLSGGRYLAKDVYLQLFTGAGPNSTGAIIDWELHKNLFLRSKVQSDNEQSLTLKYKKDF